MTGAVEVLQVEGVVPHLIAIAGVVLLLAALELDREYGRAGNQHGIDTAAQARNVELEIEETGNARQSTLKDADFLFPGELLLWIKTEGAVTN